MNKKLKLTDREWREFSVVELFDRIERGRRLTQQHRVYGFAPFVTAGESLNGISSFINNPEHRTFKRGITLDMFANTFYQNYSFKCDDNITVLLLAGKSAYVHLFLVVMLNRLKEKYSYAKQVRPHRLKREFIMLPTQVDGTPDWEFMEAYMKQVEQDTLRGALRYFNFKKCKQMLTGGGKMMPFFMEDILYIANGVRLTKVDMTIGNRPFVGASEVCNGITEFVDNTNASIDKEVLGVNYNGSVGFSFYHPYEALFSDDVKRVRWKNENANNKYTLLYLSTSIAQQRSKYAYGYKFNAHRMKRQIIMLPSQADGTPDYAYMEQTMRVMEYDALMTYLSSISV